LGPDPASIAVFAASAEGIAADVNFPASFHVVTARHEPAAWPGALEISIIIDDFTNATAIVVEGSLAPSAAAVFTPGKEMVAAYRYVSACLGVRTTGTLASMVPVYIPAPVPVVAVSTAAEPPVIIHDAAVTIAEPFQVGGNPPATEVLTNSAESVIVPPYISTGFYVRAARQ